jgi:hypothetical protein
MKGIDSTGAHLLHVPGWMDGWRMAIKAVLRIAYSNKKSCGVIIMNKMR